jgi:energy-coupling factor transport system permease protein
MQYEEKATAIHRLNTTTKVTIFFGIVILASVWWDVRLLALLLLVEIPIFAIGRVPVGWLKGMGVVFIISMIAFVPTALLTTNPLSFHVLPPSFTSTQVWVWVSAANSPTHTMIGFTFGNLYWLGALELRLLIVLLAAVSFVYTTSSSDLVQWLLRRGVPYTIGYVVMIVMRFIPILIQDSTKVIWAQKLRGWDIQSRNPAHAVAQIKPIAIPLTARILRLIDDTEQSAASRAFGHSKGTAIIIEKATPKDYAITGAAGVLAVLGIIGLVVFNIGLI